ncbi:Cof-type HAD-IIB family hydrolase [Collinsella sp. AGMB00827]|uniref:Cof-type HAD-IIB family hydrolase n=1 Tax=Collinsella ureilytica TaxID=2869515 RepID=A0ABS7MLX7_9ACTN|nr:HAD family hydrolase [Collinsella urealyticum]MBY4798364.1 Cof-type HAD-IIB family hydrolase [Collinsella urealyticum]
MLPSLLDNPNLASIKLIASDMDLTLLADDGRMPDHMYDRIRALRDAGIVFCPASGRASYTLRHMFQEVADDIGYIADNGASVFMGSCRLHTTLFDVSEYQELLRYTLEDGRGCPCVCGVERCYLRREDQVFDDQFANYYVNRVYVDDLSQVTADVNKYTVYFPDFTSEEAYANTYGPAWSSRYNVTNAGRDWIDFMKPGVDKGSGLLHLCEHLGIDISHACAIGDTYNDIQMIREAGMGCVVANAEPHMHTHASNVVPSNNEGGVAQVIDAVLEAVGAPYRPA